MNKSKYVSIVSTFAIFFSALTGLSPSQAATLDGSNPALTQSQSSLLAETIVKVSNGMRHTCAITSKGRVACWGDGPNGQLGLTPSLSKVASPTFLESLTGAVDISAGSYHTCAVLQTGQVKCWGVNSQGQLGDGSTTTSWVPVTVSGLDNAVSVSVGAYHTCALTTEGNVYCWGSDQVGYGTSQTGQLGNGLPIQDSLYPVAVTGLDTAVVQISSGESHTCALLQNDQYQCWGRGTWGQLGHGAFVNSPSPYGVSTSFNKGIERISAGFENTCALLDEAGQGEVYCWGFKTWGTLGDDGQLINGYEGTAWPVRTVVTGASYVDVGGATACAIKNREVWCWGSNQQGILQTQFVSTSGWFDARSSTPRKVSLPGPVDEVSISEGVEFENTTAGAACAWSETDVYCWGGSDATGQQGFGDFYQGSPVPQKVNFALVGPSALSIFTVNGNAVENGSSINLDYGTTSVEVIAEASDASLSVNVFGSTDLQPGDNTVTVNVLQSDGSVVATYTVNAIVSYNNDASLAVFTVNGTDVVDGDSVDLGFATTDVEVTAIPTDADATVEIFGGTDLVEGDNELIVTVVAADGISIETYTVTLTVYSNSDVSLYLLQVNGEDVDYGAFIELAPYTTEAQITAWATDPQATVEIEGGDDLAPGENLVTISVTAADNVTAESYFVYLYVPLGNDVSLASLQINGEETEDGDSIVLDTDTTEVDVYVELTDPDATATISGSDNLMLGENTVFVEVTAADGETRATYTVTIFVASNSDTSLADFTINGEAVVDGDIIYVGTVTDLQVDATANSPLATVVIDGGDSLVIGENLITVTVTASDGTERVYSVTVVVIDMGLSAWLVNDSLVQSGDEIEVEPFASEVSVEVVLSDPDNNTYEVLGATGLVPGNNQLVVKVTNQTGYVYEHSISIYVPTSVEVRVADVSLSFNSPFGDQLLSVDEGQTVRIPYLLDSLVINVETVDPRATYEVFGATDFSGQTSNVRVEVTGKDGVTKGSFEFVIENRFANVQVNVSSENTSRVLLENGGTLHLPYGESRALVTPANNSGICSVYGSEDLVTGQNVVALECLNTDGSIDLAYFYLVVDENTDTSVTSATVAGQEVQDGSRLTLDEGTEAVDVSVETTDSNATVVISGDNDLVEGENELTIWILAADGITFSVITVTLIVPKSSNTNVEAIKINGLSYLDGEVAELSEDTTDVEVEVNLDDPDASFTISGGENLKPGINPLVIRVTAANQIDSATYTILLNVAMSSDASWNLISVNGIEWAEDVPIEVTSRNLDVFVETNHPQATVAVIGKTRNVHGIFDLEVVVTAQDGETTQSATVTIWATENIAVTPLSSADGPELRVGSRIKVAQLPTFDRSYNYFYYWLRDGEVINDDLLQTYVLKPEDLEGSFRPYIYGMKPGAEPISFLGNPLTILPGIIKKAPVPSIVGSPIVGKTLTLSTKRWPEAVELSYQWYSDGQPIDGATETSFEVLPELMGTRISVGVTGNLPGYLPMEKTSKGVLVKPGTFKFLKTPKVSGAFSTGRTITVDPGLWPEFAEVSVIWKRNGEEVASSGEVENGYTFTGEDYKSKFSVVVKASAPGYLDSEFVLTRVVSMGYFSYIPKPVVIGESGVGETLSVELPELPEFAEVTYLWKRNGTKIAAASESEYEVQARDFGMFVSVVIVISATGYKSVALESQPLRIRTK